MLHNLTKQERDEARLSNKKREGTTFMYRILVALVAILATPSLATAADGPSFGGPIGATDLGNAYLPPVPGFYLGVVTGYGWASKLYDNNYKGIPVTASNEVTAFYLMYKYPFKVLGGDLASGIEEGYQTDSNIDIPNSPRPKNEFTGWLDTYVDFLNWSRYVGPLFGGGRPAGASDNLPYGLTVKAEYSMIFPTGHYSPTALANPSGGTFYYIPNAAVTYLTPPDGVGEGVEINLHAFLDVQSKNWATRYQSGNVADFDFAIGQRIRNWNVGVAGFYAVQISNDQIGPSRHMITVTPDGNRLEALTLGPIASVYVSRWHVFFKVKAPLLIQARNLLGISAVFFNAVFKF